MKKDFNQTPPNNLSGNGCNKDTKLTEYQQVYRAFYSDNPKNALQVSVETGIRRANITRYIGRMKRTDRISVVYIGMCPITKYGKVQFLTTKFDEISNKKGGEDEYKNSQTHI